MASKRQIEKPFNGGKWSSARMRSFIISAIRSASSRWGPKFECIRAAYVGDGINPATGRKCKLHRCSHCRELFPQNKVQADHIEPIVDPEVGFVSWDEYIKRCFREVEGYQVLCRQCHSIKTSGENLIARERKRSRSNQA